jgi:hypothetical protein
MWRYEKLMQHNDAIRLLLSAELFNFFFQYNVQSVSECNE